MRNGCHGAPSSLIVAYRNVPEEKVIDRKSREIMGHPSNPLSLLVLLSMSVQIHIAAAEDVVVRRIQPLGLGGNDLIRIEADTERGFNFPFFLFVPEGLSGQQRHFLYVETNNTGTTSDDPNVHLDKARRLITGSYPNQIARRLHCPLLVPTFPRPRSNWQCYTHALDRDTLEIEGGPLERIDLQLLAMIDFARQLLEANGIHTDERVFMHGFSASAKFCNRFAFLHPTRVKAVACGGVNGLPTLPLSERNGRILPFPIGIADVEKLTGKPYDREAHQRVAQYVYMGYFDRNDTLPSRDAWNEEEASIIRAATAARMMPDRWDITQAVYRVELPCAQCVTYNGVGHAIKDEMIEDIVKFFGANAGETFVRIEPHVYPFKEYRQLKEVHVNGLYWKGDAGIPPWVAKDLREGTLLLGIKEWIPGQNHRQLDEFVENAGFDFVLRAEDRPDIVLSKANYGGNCSAGDGTFQAFYVNLDPPQCDALATDVPYTLHPKDAKAPYAWRIDDVTLVPKANYEPLVRTALDATVFSHVSIDMDVKDVARWFNALDIHIDDKGDQRQVDFVIQGGPEQLSNTPRIQFSAEGLSATELLMVICRRASLEYHIEGTTVVLTHTP